MTAPAYAIGHEDWIAQSNRRHLQKTASCGTFGKAINVMVMLGGTIDRKRVQAFLKKIPNRFFAISQRCLGLGARGETSCVCSLPFVSPLTWSTCSRSCN